MVHGQPLLLTALYLGTALLSAVAITTADPCALYTAPLRVVLHNGANAEVSVMVYVYDTEGTRVFRSPVRVAAQSETSIEAVESEPGAYELQVVRLADRKGTGGPVSVGRCYFSAHVWMDSSGFSMTQDVG